MRMAFCFSKRIHSSYRNVHMRMFSNYTRKVRSASRRPFIHKNLISSKTKCLIKSFSWTNPIESAIVNRNIHTKNHLLNSENVENGSEVNIQEDEFRLIYEGPLLKKIKILKFFSLSTASLSVIAGPAILFLGHASISMFSKLFLATSVVTMGVTTTIILHWLTRVYVYNMYFNLQSRTFAAETSSLFGGVRRNEFSVEDIVLPEVEAAFSTFEARGNKYFIHMDLKEAEQILKYIKDYNLETL